MSWGRTCSEAQLTCDELNSGHLVTPLILLVCMWTVLEQLLQGLNGVLSLNRLIFQIYRNS